MLMRPEHTVIAQTVIFKDPTAARRLPIHLRRAAVQYLSLPVWGKPHVPCLIGYTYSVKTIVQKFGLSAISNVERN